MLAGWLAMTGGCATITKGSSQNVTVDTDPSAAICTLTREGKVIAVVNPTPGTVNVTKAQGDLVVTCQKPEYLEAVGNVGSKFQPMTFGNILFGGLIGVVVDAASGAMSEYEPTVTIRMVPAAFASIQARDQFFERRREEFLAETARVRERIERMCSGQDCPNQLAEVEKEKEVGLARIEAQRQSARIDPAAPATPNAATTPTVPGTPTAPATPTDPKQ